MATRKAIAPPARGSVKAPAPSRPAKPTMPAATAKPEASKLVKPEKAPKKAPKVPPKLVRDGFTMPEADFALIAKLKSRALAVRREVKKSELLRAGLHALAALDVKSLVATLDRLEPVKTGRPKKGH